MAVDAKAMETINSWSREVSQQQAERVLNEYSPAWLKANQEVFPEPYKTAARLIIMALDMPISTPEPPVKKSARPKGYEALAAAIKAKTVSKQTIHAACVAGEITPEQKDALYALIDSTGKPASSKPAKKPASAVPSQWARSFKLETLEVFSPLTPTSTPEEVSEKIKELGKAAELGKVNVKAWTQKFFNEVAPLYSAETGWKRPEPQPEEAPAPAPEQPTVDDTDTSVDSAALSALAIPDLTDL